MADDLEISCEHSCAISASGTVTEIVLGLIAIVGACVAAVGALMGLAVLTDLVGEAGVINIMLLFK